MDKSGKEIENKSEIFFIITFDDGLKEQYTFALPILDELNIPALFFINPSNLVEKKVSPVHQLHLLRSEIEPKELNRIIKNYLIDINLNIELSAEELEKALIHYNYDTEEDAIFKYQLNIKIDFRERDKIIDLVFDKYLPANDWINELYMNIEEIQNLANRKLLGTHTYHHYPVGLLNDVDKEFEIFESVKQIKNLTNGYSPFAISFPYGSYDSVCKKTIEFSLKSGLSYGFTMERCANVSLSNPLILARFDCNDVPGGKSNLFNTKDDLLNANTRCWDYEISH
ncbi:MAG: polysaccharide deacetylase family protein [Bacteroidia bacterium]|nr:polysaccharide deacetylase family protein [Bacteroidia bacterium]